MAMSRLASLSLWSLFVFYLGALSLFGSSSPKASVCSSSELDSLQYEGPFFRSMPSVFLPLPKLRFSKQQQQMIWQKVQQHYADTTSESIFPLERLVDSLRQNNIWEQEAPELCVAKYVAALAYSTEWKCPSATSGKRLAPILKHYAQLRNIAWPNTLLNRLSFLHQLQERIGTNLFKNEGATTMIMREWAYCLSQNAEYCSAYLNDFVQQEIKTYASPKLREALRREQKMYEQFKRAFYDFDKDVNWRWGTMGPLIYEGHLQEIHKLRDSCMVRLATGLGTGAPLPTGDAVQQKIYFPAKRNRLMMEALQLGDDAQARMEAKRIVRKARQSLSSFLTARREVQSFLPAKLAPLYAEDTKRHLLWVQNIIEPY